MKKANPWASQYDAKKRSGLHCTESTKGHEMARRIMLLTALSDTFEGTKEVSIAWAEALTYTLSPAAKIDTSFQYRWIRSHIGHRSCQIFLNDQKNYAVFAVYEKLMHICNTCFRPKRLH